MKTNLPADVQAFDSNMHAAATNTFVIFVGFYNTAARAGSVSFEYTLANQVCQTDTSNVHTHQELVDIESKNEPTPMNLLLLLELEAIKTALEFLHSRQATLSKRGMLCVGSEAKRVCMTTQRRCLKGNGKAEVKRATKRVRQRLAALHTDAGVIIEMKEYPGGAAFPLYKQVQANAKRLAGSI